MASPLGHALAGYAIGRSTQDAARPDFRVLAVCAALAVAPDLDFLPGVLEGRPAAYHQGASHSLVAAAIVAAVAALALGRVGVAFTRGWPICFAAYASHLAMDWVGQDARVPVGIPLFWPLSDGHWLSPLTLLPGIEHASSSDVSNAQWLSSIFTSRNAYALLFEVALAAPFVAIAELRRRRVAEVAH